MPLVWRAGEDARLATSHEAFSHVGANARGLDLGRYYDDQSPYNDGREIGGPIIYDGDRHGFLFGPTGTGKTSAWLMRMLLGDALDHASVVVTDPKGELAAVTAVHRADIPGNRVKIIDPFGKLKELAEKDPKLKRALSQRGLLESVGFSPMAMLDINSPNFYDDAAALSEGLIEIEDRDSHWSQSAQGLITGLTMLEKVWNGEHASLANVRHMLTEAEKTAGEKPEKVEEPVAVDKTTLRNIQQILSRLEKEKSTGFDADTLKLARELLIAKSFKKRRPIAKDAPVAGLRFTVLKALAQAEREITAAAQEGREVRHSWDVIASLLARFSQSTREIDSIKSVADTQTRWLLSRSLQKDLAKEGFKFSELKETRTTVYLIIPAERIRTYSAWLRLLIVSALRSLYTPGGNRTVFLLDEMPALGRLDPLSDAFAVMRGFNVQLVGIAQDMVQLKDLYKERYESFMANAGFLQFFTPNDLTTAGWISRRAGQKPIIVKGFSSTEKPMTTDPFPTSESETTNQQAIPLYRPEELMGIETWKGLLFFSGLQHPVPFHAPMYEHVTLTRARAQKNPYQGRPPAP